MKTRNLNARRKLPWGPVCVSSGKHKGRIGFYDDDGPRGGRIVYFGDIMLDSRCFSLRAQLRPVTMADLAARRQAIRREIGFGGDPDLTVHSRAELLDELVLVEGEMVDRLWTAQFQKVDTPRRVFISHSSQDKRHARMLAADLKTAGHAPWLDEWEVRVGESIPKRINQAVDDCEAMLLLLSKHSVESPWVEEEWHAKYWEAVRTKRMLVLPILLEECTVPALLRHRKHANVGLNYSVGLNEVLYALQK